MAAEVHVGDVGTVFRATVKDENGEIVALGTATLRQIIFQKPDGSTLDKTASLTTDGSDGEMQYVSVQGDLDQAGTWAVQGYVEFGSGGKWHSDRHTFRVESNLD